MTQYSSEISFFFLTGKNYTHSDPSRSNCMPTRAAKLRCISTKKLQVEKNDQSFIFLRTNTKALRSSFFRALLTTSLRVVDTNFFEFQFCARHSENSLNIFFALRVTDSLHNHLYQRYVFSPTSYDPHIFAQTVHVFADRRTYSDDRYLMKSLLCLRRIRSAVRGER